MSGDSRCRGPDPRGGLLCAHLPAQPGVAGGGPVACPAGQGLREGGPVAGWPGRVSQPVPGFPGQPGGGGQAEEGARADHPGRRLPGDCGKCVWGGGGRTVLWSRIFLPEPVTIHRLRAVPHKLIFVGNKFVKLQKKNFKYFLRQFLLFLSNY